MEPHAAHVPPSATAPPPYAPAPAASSAADPPASFAAAPDPDISVVYTPQMPAYHAPPASSHYPPPAETVIATPLPPPAVSTFINPDTLPGPDPAPPTPEQLSALRDQGFTSGLARSVASSVAAFPLRIWVVDNSGSMGAVDGRRFVDTSRRNDVRTVGCTRWREMRDAVMYHARMAALLRAPTVFRMLNDPGAAAGPQRFGIADKGPGTSVERDLEVAGGVMDRCQPGGVTPLALHIREIRDEIASLAPTLSQRGQRVVVVLATDGLPTDQSGVCDEYRKADFVDAIRTLEGLPVWVVVRLCTNDDSVVSFYNDLDRQLELSLEVLDDFVHEAEEVHSQNRWLNYALPLHRCREMGFHDRLFDLIEERPLTKDELREFCVLLFGRDKFDGVPEPAVDMKGFVRAVERMADGEGGQWNPVKGRVMPWVDGKKIRHDYGGGGWFW